MAFQQEVMGYAQVGNEAPALNLLNAETGLEAGPSMTAPRSSSAQIILCVQ